MSTVRLVESEPGQSRYAALAAAMRARIVAGEWPPGSAIPAEHTLAAEHGVALGTMRRALDLLAEQGLVVLGCGPGEQALRLRRLRSVGSQPALHARALRLPAGHPCARVQRQAFDLSGRCVEWRTTLGDANAFHYTVSIT